MDLYFKGQSTIKVDDTETRPRTFFKPNGKTYYPNQLEVITFECEIEWYTDQYGNIVGRGVFAKLPGYWPTNQQPYILLVQIPFVIHDPEPSRSGWSH